MNKKNSNTQSEKRILTSALVVCVTFAVLFSAAFVFSQDAVRAKKEDLQVPPPSYANFDASMTQNILEILNSPVVKAQRELSASEMGGYTFDSMKISCFSTDRSLDEVIGYFAEKLGQEPEIETNTLVDSPEEMKEMEKLTGSSWDKTLMAKYQKAYKEYMGEESRKANFTSGRFPEENVLIEIENPYLDLSSFKKVNKTSIMYIVMSFKKN